MEKPDFRVSDHAVLRYMERAMGMNVEMVREHIANICRGYAAVGASCLRQDGLRFEMANNAVITVTPDDNNLSKTARARNQDAIKRKRDAFFDQVDARYAARNHRDRRGPRAERQPIAISVADPGAAGFAGFPEPERPFEILPGGLAGGHPGDIDGAQ